MKKIIATLLAIGLTAAFASDANKTEKKAEKKAEHNKTKAEHKAKKAEHNTTKAEHKAEKNATK